MSPTPLLASSLALLVLPVGLARAQAPAGEGPALGPNRITQAEIEAGVHSLDDLRAAGLRVFSTPFNELDGFGDGPMDPVDTSSPGGRPTLQGNGTFLRVNGLDSQTCLECHAIGSSASIPARFEVGGAGLASANVLAGPRTIDVTDQGASGFAAFDGRFINPPFLFGSGGVELLGREMTADLQALRELALASPGAPVALDTHGVSFGTLVLDASTGRLDFSGVHGVARDLVVRPFGRKGEFTTVRDFAANAMMFHFGMQPAEKVGPGVDGDQDGVLDEILVGELSALHVFGTNLERPIVEAASSEVSAGFETFEAIGCASCHVPALATRSTQLTYSFPEVAADPTANVYYSSDLLMGPAKFGPAPGGGVRVALFSDLKRHDMGPRLTEASGSHLDPHFVTARLWGIADTAPYLHDGRATTLTEAILWHGGEAQPAREAFAALPDAKRAQLLTFLRALRTPSDVAKDVY